MSRHMLYSGVALLAAMAPATAYAQNSGASPSASSAAADDTIIVTARRRAEDVSKVPIAITAFSGTQLEAKGIRTTEDLAKITPGLTFATGGGRSNPFIVLRGQSRAVTGNGSAGVIIYQNDVPLPNGGSVLPTFDMANVQVVKGPQGTLFGRNSIGGAILAVTQAPTHEFGGYVSGTVAQWDTYQGEGAINLPIIKDKVALRLAAQVGHETNHIKTFSVSPYTINTTTFTATPGQLLGPSNHQVGEYANESYRASLLIEPVEGIKNVTVFDYSKYRGTSAIVAAFDTGQGLYTFPTFAPDPTRPYLPTIVAAIGQGAAPDTAQGGFALLYASFVQSLAQCSSGAITCNYLAANAAVANAGPRRISYVTQDPWASFAKIWGVVNTTTISLGENHQLKNIFGYRRLQSYSNNPLQGYPIPVINTSNTYNMRQTTEELQLSGSFFDNDLKYTLGGFLYNEKPNGTGGYGSLEVGTFFGLSHTFTATYLHNSSQAIYGQVDYSLDKLIPGLTVTAGARQTWDSQSACASSATISPLGPQELQSSYADSQVYLPSEQQCLNKVQAPAALVATLSPGGTINNQTFPDSHFKKLTWTFGANWQISPDAMVYVTHRRGYRAGGYNTPQFDPYLAQFQTFAPETLTDWELGTKIKFETGGMRGNLNLALFSGKDSANQLPINSSNLANGVCVPAAIGTPGHPVADCTTAKNAVAVESSPVPGANVTHGAATTTVNGGALTIRGVEVDAMISPIPGLSFTGSLAYTDIKVDAVTVDARLRDFLTRAGIAPGNGITIQGQPTWTYNAGVSFTPQIKILGGDLTATVDYRHTDKYTIVQLDVPASNQVDARLELANVMGSNLDVAAWVRNLTNRTNYVGNASSSAALGMQSYVLGSPRQFGLTVKYTFGR